MDTALQLRINEDNGIKLTEREISSLLEKSILVKKLTGKIKEDPMFLIWRIVALSEIPHSNQLPYTQKIINLIINILGSSVGFTLTGKKENFLPCYNAILIKAFCKLGLHLDETVKNGIEWILKYQSFERNFKTEWKETEILKHGGCLKSTPCYIGVTKSVMALHEYNKFHLEMYVEDKVRLGLEYILQHHLIRRLSNDQPISKHILDLYFPENYNVNIL